MQNRTGSEIFSVSSEITNIKSSRKDSQVPACVFMAHVVIGSMQICIGILVIVLGIIGLVVGSHSNLGLIGSGVWAGPFFIIAGVSGVVISKGAKRFSLGWVITCLVFCIIATCLSFTAMVLESIVTAGNQLMHGGSYNWQQRPGSTNEGIFKVVYVTGVMCVLMFVIEFVIAIVHIVVACRSSCCCVSGLMEEYKPRPQPYQHDQENQTEQQDQPAANVQSSPVTGSGTRPD